MFGTVVPNKAESAPGSAAVRADLEDGIDVPGVAGAGLPALAYGQYVCLRTGHDHGRNAECVVALGAADKRHGPDQSPRQLGQKALRHARRRDGPGRNKMGFAGFRARRPITPAARIAWILMDTSGWGMKRADYSA